MGHVLLAEPASIQNAGNFRARTPYLLSTEIGLHGGRGEMGMCAGYKAVSNLATIVAQTNFAVFGNGGKPLGLCVLARIGYVPLVLAT